MHCNCLGNKDSELDPNPGNPNEDCGPFGLC